MFIHSTLADYYILKYLLYKTLSKITLVFGVTLDTHTYMVFQSNTASRIQNEIVGDLFGTRYGHVF